MAFVDSWQRNTNINKLWKSKYPVTICPACEMRSYVMYDYYILEFYYCYDKFITHLMVNSLLHKMFDSSIWWLYISEKQRESSYTLNQGKVR